MNHAHWFTWLQRATSILPGGKVLKRRLHNSATACGLALQLSKVVPDSHFTIIMYHRMLDRPDPYYPLGYGIDLGVFTAQLRMFARFCAVLSLDEILARLDAGKRLPRRCIALTFDDGYRDVVTRAWPLLKRYRLPATVTVTVQGADRGFLWPDALRHAIRYTTESSLALETFPGAQRVLPLASESDRIGAVERLDAALKQLPNHEKEAVMREVITKLLHIAPEELTIHGLMLSWEELQVMASSGISIGAHTITHPILTRVPEAEAQREIVEARRILTERLGVPVTHFAYPNGEAGDFSPRIERLVADAGFRSACTTVHGMNQRSDNRFALKRINGALTSVRKLVYVIEEAACPA